MPASSLAFYFSQEDKNAGWDVEKEYEEHNEEYDPLHSRADLQFRSEVMYDSLFALKQLENLR